MDTCGPAAKMLLANGFARFKASSEVALAISNAYAASHKFFDLPLNEKIASRLPRDLGYRPYGIEYSVSAEHPDQVESFSASRRLEATDMELPSVEARALYREAMHALSLLEPLAEEIVVTLAREISPDVDLSYIRGGLQGWSVLQLNRACLPQIATEQSSELHEDGCLLTLMAHDGPGLEIRTSDGSFDAITLAQDELLAIPGEIMTLLSGGRIQPLYHRVKMVPNLVRRMAMLWFGDLNPALCVPWVQSAGSESINIGERVRGNGKRYGLPEWDL